MYESSGREFMTEKVAILQNIKQDSLDTGHFTINADKVYPFVSAN